MDIQDKPDTKEKEDKGLIFKSFNGIESPEKPDKKPKAQNKFKSRVRILSLTNKSKLQKISLNKICKAKTMANIDLTIHDKHFNEIYSFNGITDWKIRYYMQEMKEEIQKLEKDKENGFKKRRRQFKKYLWSKTKNQTWLKEHRICLWISLLLILLYYLFRYDGNDFRDNLIVGISSMIYGSM